MAPFTLRHRSLYDAIVAAVEGERGPELIAAAVQYSQTNCSWLDYQVADLVEMAAGRDRWEAALAKWEAE